MDNLIRINKYLSQKNILSRRKAEEAILKGLIILNGKVVTDVGQKIDPHHDVLELHPSIKQDDSVLIAFHKPRGIVTNLPQGDEKEIKDLLPKEFKHLSAIGRLDKDSEGLILLTDNGIWAKKLLDPDHPHTRVYEVTIDQPFTDYMAERLESGIFILGKKTKPTTIEKLAFKTFRITMAEGKNRQIRRMLETLSARVTVLKRTDFGCISLDHLEPGAYDIIDNDDLKRLRLL